MCHFGQAYLSCGKKQEHASLPPSFLPSFLSFMLSLLSKKRGEARWYNSNRSSKSHDCRSRNGGKVGPIASPSSSSSFPAAAVAPSVESYNRRRNSARGPGLAREGGREGGREEERDGRARYLPETKANRSISRSAFLFEGEQRFSDMKVTVY